MGEPAGRRGRVDLAADDGEPDLAAGGLRRAGGLDRHAEMGERTGGPLVQGELRLAVVVETAADAAGAVASNAALAASRVMLRFTGTSCQGWAAADTGAQPLAVGARAELAQPRAPCRA